MVELRGIEPLTSRLPVLWLIFLPCLTSIDTPLKIHNFKHIQEILSLIYILVY